jgi:hypothetical protein
MLSRRPDNIDGEDISSAIGHLGIKEGGEGWWRIGHHEYHETGHEYHETAVYDNLLPRWKGGGAPRQRQNSVRRKEEPPASTP